MKSALSRITFTVGVLSLAASFLLVSVGNAQWNIWTPWNRTSSGTAVSSSSSMPAADGTSPEDRIVTVVAAAQPSVVSVIISKDLPVLEQRMQTLPFQDPFGGYDPFFRQFQIQVPQIIRKGTQKQEVGGGTAFFVTGDGLLLTNKHVVDDPKAEYTVLLNDGRKLPATVAGIDPANDIALLKVQGTGFTPLAVAQNDDLRLGQTAIAIGNALGEFRNTVSVGVVSGLQRSITAGGGMGGDTERLDQIIQTDAAINRGNSGGPLLDSRGAVIGMSTAVADNAQNIGFAIPAAELRRVLTGFQKNGRIITPYMGVRYAPLTDDLRSKNHITQEYGVLVGSGENSSDPAIMPGSPAEKAGLKDGDVILSIDGRKLTADVSLAHIIQTKAPGDVVTLEVLRDGKTMQVRVTLEERKP